MDKGTGKLDEAFIKSILRSLTLRQPKFLQDIMSFVEKLAIEALEIAQVMSIQALAPATLNQCCDFCTFVTHRRRVGDASKLSKSRRVSTFGYQQGTCLAVDIILSFPL
ncbi:MAG: hypothetical protein JWM16_3503 [Verrucomicrobiales bacterium]|nr:hypothetical protein [Verrucomicrobiales bacterium]